VGIIRQFVTILAHFLKETARVKRAVTLTRNGKAWGEEVEHVFGTGAGYVEEPALFLDIPILDGTSQGQKTVGHA
jgi:hypothetical protein